MGTGSPGADATTTPTPRAESAISRQRRHRFWIIELVLVAFGYWLYTLIRNGVSTQESVAVNRGEKLVRLERSLHLFHEHVINNVVAAHHWLAYFCNYYYATLHFVVTIVVGVWVLTRHPHYARGLRTAWYATNCIALLGFAFFALAPPRLLPGGGFTDTVVQFHTWGSWGDASVAAHSNQYAAMPSMHIGWSLWVAVVVVRLARHRWVQVAGAFYPVSTLFVIVGTGNHYILDAVGGAIALAGGFLVARVFHGGPIVPRRRPAGTPPAARELPEMVGQTAGGPPEPGPPEPGTLEPGTPGHAPGDLPMEPAGSPRRAAGPPPAPRPPASGRYPAG